MSPETERLTYDSDRLIREWQDRYTRRRTVSWQMLQEAQVLVRDAIARELEQERREAKSERERDLERRERAVEHAERLQQSRMDRLKRELAESREKIASLSPRQTLMREERETVEDGTMVRLLAPTTPSYGDKTSPRPWMLGELEDVIHRLRMAGGGESTEVRFKRDAIEACVPFPEFALTPAKRTAPTSIEREESAKRPVPRSVVLAAWMAIVLALMGVVAVVAS